MGNSEFQVLANRMGDQGLIWITISQLQWIFHLTRSSSVFQSIMHSLPKTLCCITHVFFITGHSKNCSLTPFQQLTGIWIINVCVILIEIYTSKKFNNRHKTASLSFWHSLHVSNYVIIYLRRADKLGRIEDWRTICEKKFPCTYQF